MPPSLIGTKSFAGQALTHAFVVQLRHTSESTVMWARLDTRKSTVAMRSSNETLGQAVSVRVALREEAMVPSVQVASPP